MNNIAPDEITQGYVNITFEIVDSTGTRSHVVRESYLQSEFILNCENQLVARLQKMSTEVKKEILTPSVKTDMA